MFFFFFFLFFMPHRALISILLLYAGNLIRGNKFLSFFFYIQLQMRIVECERTMNRDIEGNDFGSDLSPDQSTGYPISTILPRDYQMKI